MKRREFNKRLSAATAVALLPFSRARKVLAATTASGATPVFSFANGFANASNTIHLANDAAFSGSVIRLLNVPGHQSAAAWYVTQQPPTAFTTQFTFQPTNLGSTGTACGMTFCIQNTNVLTGAASYGDKLDYCGDANMCGYGGGITQNPPIDSMAIKFDATGPGEYAKGSLPSSTGMYFNGGPSVASGSLGLFPCNDLYPYGINFYSGHTFSVTIVYDGSLLTMVLLDTTTNAQARCVWPLNLANTTNATGNWVGFTAGSPVQGVFSIQTWSYWSGYNTRLATPTMSPAPGQYSGTQTVAINYPPGSTCYYTTNGLLPTSASTRYTGPITVSANRVIQAVAIQSGFTDSLVAEAGYQINTSNVVNFPSGFSAGDLITVGWAYSNGSAICVSDTQTNTVGSAWYPVPVSIQTFSCVFMLQWNSGASGNGMCFVIQNNPAPYTSRTGNVFNWSGGPTTVAIGATSLGYGGLNGQNLDLGGGTAWGILNSVAIAFDLFTVVSSIGVYTNGKTPLGLQIPTGLVFASGHPFTVALAYSGTTLSLTMTDTVTGAKFSHNYTVDIPSIVGANTAYVGFTGGTGGATAVQQIQSWTMSGSQTQAQTAAVPAAPTNLVVK